jgi:hypothetical protein
MEDRFGEYCGLEDATEDCPAGEEIAGAGQSGTSANALMNVSPASATSSGPAILFTVAVTVIGPVFCRA